VNKHIRNDTIKLKATDWAPTMIQALWGTMLHLWQYRNEALQENDMKKVAQFKVEALDRDIELLEARHEDLRSKLRAFQKQHVQRL
jgi:hypothetical protein